MASDLGLTTLLEFDGPILDQGNGYWAEMHAWTVPPTRDIAHGLRYSLTLHEPHGGRILGYDNAHAPRKPKKFRFSGQRLPYARQEKRP